MFEDIDFEWDTTNVLILIFGLTSCVTIISVVRCCKKNNNT